MVESRQFVARALENVADTAIRVILPGCFTLTRAGNRKITGGSKAPTERNTLGSRTGRGPGPARRFRGGPSQVPSAYVLAPWQPRIWRCEVCPQWTADHTTATRAASLPGCSWLAIGRRLGLCRHQRVRSQKCPHPPARHWRSRSRSELRIARMRGTVAKKTQRRNKSIFCRHDINFGVKATSRFDL